MDGSDSQTHRSDAGGDSAESQKSVGKAASGQAKSVAGTQQDWTQQPDETPFANKWMGLALVVVLLGAFSFLVYHKYNLKQQNLAHQQPTANAEEDQVIAGLVQQQQQTYAEFQPRESAAVQHTVATQQASPKQKLLEKSAEADNLRFEATSFPSVAEQSAAADTNSAAPEFDLTEPALAEESTFPTKRAEVSEPDFDADAANATNVVRGDSLAAPSSNQPAAKQPAGSDNNFIASVDAAAPPTESVAANINPRDSFPAFPVDPTPSPDTPEDETDNDTAIAAANPSTTGAPAAKADPFLAFDAGSKTVATSEPAAPAASPETSAAQPADAFPSFAVADTSVTAADLQKTEPVPVFPASDARELPSTLSNDDQWIAAAEDPTPTTVPADESALAETNTGSAVDTPAEPPVTQPAHASPFANQTGDQTGDFVTVAPVVENQTPTAIADSPSFEFDSPPARQIPGTAPATKAELVLSVPTEESSDSVPANARAEAGQSANDSDLRPGSIGTLVETNPASTPAEPRRMQPGEEFLFPTPVPAVKTAETTIGVARFVEDEPVQQVAGVADECEILTVQPNDNYWKLSRRAYGSARYFSSLALYNQHRIPDPKKLRPGMKVLIPAPEVLQKRYPEFFEDLQPKKRLPTGFFVQADGKAAYRVGERETLSEISQRHLGRASRWIQIYRLNQQSLSDPNRLKPGTVLILPDDATNVRMAP